LSLALLPHVLVPVLLFPLDCVCEGSGCRGGCLSLTDVGRLLGSEVRVLLSRCIGVPPSRRYYAIKASLGLGIRASAVKVDSSSCYQGRRC
jgi:hypothetical protein